MYPHLSICNYMYRCVSMFFVIWEFVHVYIYMYIYIVYIYGLGNPHKICDFWSKFQAVGFTGGYPTYIGINDTDEQVQDSRLRNLLASKPWNRWNPGTDSG